MRFSLLRKIGVATAIAFVVLFGAVNLTHAGGAGYFCDTSGDHDPANLSNYADDLDCTLPSTSLPDFSSQGITIISGAIYDGDLISSFSIYNDGTITGNAEFGQSSINNGTVGGNAIFNDSSINNGTVSENADFPIAGINNGTVTGDATFGNSALNDVTGVVSGTATFTGDTENRGTVSGDAEFQDSSDNNGTVTGNAIFYDSTQNNGTVNGIKTRHFIVSTTSNENFVTTGPWIVIADGAVVDIQAAVIDDTTTLTTINGGSFLSSSITNIISNGVYVILTYNTTLDVTSVPDPTDFVIINNDSTISVTNVDISGTKVTLTLAEGIIQNDIATISYTPGIRPLQRSTVLPANAFSEQSIEFELQNIPVGEAPFYVTSIGTKVYVTNRDDDTVSVINTINDTVIATIAVGDRPGFMAVIGTKVYVANRSGSTVSVIDSITDTVAKTIDVSSTGDTGYITIVGTKAYVHSETNISTVSIIDTLTDTVIGTIPSVPGNYNSVVVGKKLYINEYGGSHVSVVNTDTDTVIARPLVGDSPVYSAVAGTKIYVGNLNSPYTSVIDSITDTTIASIVTTHPLLADPFRVGEKVYIDNGPGISIINTATDTIDTVFSGLRTTHFNIFGKYLYAPIPRGFARIDTVNNTITNIVDTNSAYTNFGVIVGTKLYGNVQSRNSVMVLDTSTTLPMFPNLTSFSTSSPSGTYNTGDSITITANFGRTLASGSTMTVLLNSGASVVLNQRSGSTLSGTYTVASGNQSPDLQVTSITSASVTDGTNTRTSYDLPTSQGSFDGENSFITRNLGDAKNISINATPETVDVGANPYQISSLINGSIYVANQGDNSVSVINATTNLVTDTISVGGEPYGLANVGTKLYVANILTNDVSVIDTTTNDVIETIDVGIKPYYVAVIGTNVYVTNGASNTVSVIDSTTDTVTDTIAVGAYPRGIKAHGTDLYVANYGDPNYSGGNYISVIDSLTNTVSDTIISPADSDGPRGVTVLGDNVYVANFRSNNVSVIDTATNTIVDTIDVGMGPRGMAGTGTTLYVENFDDGTISVINTSTNEVTDTVDVGSSPSGITIINGTAYITSFQDNRVYRLATATNILAGVTPPDDEPTSPPIHHSSGSAPISNLPLNPAPTVCPPGHLFSVTTGLPCTTSSTPPLTVPGTPTTPSTPNTPSTPFTRNLSWKMTGPDVTALQHYLNTHGFPVAPSGVGSLGFETQYFGLATKAALIKFQLAHQITPAIGFFGPVTRGFVNSN